MINMKKLTTCEYKDMKKIIYIAIFLLIGCGAKKKTVHREKQSAIVTRINDVSLQNDTNTHITAKTIREAKKTVYTPVSSDKPLIIEDETGKQTKIYNAKVEVEDVKEQVDSVKKVQQQTSLVDKSTEKVQLKSSSRSTDTKILRMNPFVAIGIGVGLLVVVVMLYRRYFS